MNCNSRTFELTDLLVVLLNVRDLNFSSLKYFEAGSDGLSEYVDETGQEIAETSFHEKETAMWCFKSFTTMMN